MHILLPTDFRDRPRLERWWINVLILLRIRTIKRVCCESFRNPQKMMACKGCATLYDPNSAHWFYRLAARVGKLRGASASSRDGQDDVKSASVRR